jgi:formiminotetrahydrofolate cyclodeaminase
VNGLADATLSGFLARLASGAPTPGGGAVAALTGAQAAALLAMAVRVSAGDHGAASAPGAGAADTPLLRSLDDVRRKLLDLATEDGVAFAGVMTAYKLPKGTGAEQEARKSAIQLGLKRAAQPPLEVMRAAGLLFELAAKAMPDVKTTVVSDALIAVHLLGATLQAAACNVRINLDGIKDDAFNAQAKSEMTRLFELDARERPRLLALTGKP